MGKKHLNPRARDRLRQFDEARSPTFETTISVVRRIIIDGEAGEEFSDKLKRNLGENLTRNRKKHYRVLDPKTISLKLVDNVPVDPKYAREIAYALDHRIGGLIKEARAPQYMALPAGRVACFSEVNPARRLRSRNVVGVEPNGWRGPGRRYAAYDKQGALTAMGLLVAESQICASVLGQTKTPFAPIALNALDIPRRELMLVQAAAEDALPEVMEWQDPQIILRTGPSWSEEEVIDVRAPVYDLAA